MNFLKSFDLIWMGNQPKPYSPDLASSDFHLFTELKEFLGEKRRSNDDAIRQTAEEWLKELAGEAM